MYQKQYNGFNIWDKAIVANNFMKLKLLILAIGAVLFTLLVLASGIRVGSDDTWFREHTTGYTLTEWVSERYDGWSGRVTAEAFTFTVHQLPVPLWRVANVVFLVALTLLLYKYYTLLASRRTERKDLYMLIFSVAAPFLVGVSALLDGVFWITGSLNYLWVVVIGMIAFYPLLYTYTKRQNPSHLMMGVGVAAALLAGFGQEQVFALLVGFSGLVVLGLYLKTRKIWIYPLCQFLVTLAAALVSYLAPGNDVRMGAEIATWLPTFESVAPIDRIEWSLRWFMDATINQFGYVFVLIWALTGILLFSGSSKLAKVRRIDVGIASVLIFASLLYFGVTAGLNLFNFYPHWGIAAFPLASYFYLAFWMVVLALMPIGLYRVARLYMKGSYALPLMNLATLVAIGLMVFSPTMYASGTRVLFVPAVLGLLSVILLANLLFDAHWKYRKVILPLLLFVPVVHVFNVTVHLVVALGAAGF